MNKDNLPSIKKKLIKPFNIFLISQACLILIFIGFYIQHRSYTNQQTANLSVISDELHKAYACLGYDVKKPEPAIEYKVYEPCIEKFKNLAPLHLTGVSNVHFLIYAKMTSILMLHDPSLTQEQKSNLSKQAQDFYSQISTIPVLGHDDYLMWLYSYVDKKGTQAVEKEYSALEFESLEKIVNFDRYKMYLEEVEQFSNNHQEDKIPQIQKIYIDNLVTALD